MTKTPATWSVIYGGWQTTSGFAQGGITIIVEYPTIYTLKV
jgi:hypothetical protein